jgi:hypothetical protein
MSDNRMGIALGLLTDALTAKEIKVVPDMVNRVLKIFETRQWLVSQVLSTGLAGNASDAVAECKILEAYLDGEEMGK